MSTQCAKTSRRILGDSKRAFKAAEFSNTPRKTFSTTPVPSADFTHAVIGGGAVGLAIARRLQFATSSPSVVLIEKHSHPGMETSSRNSEVIHAGLYYGFDTLKTNLCIQGRKMIYDLCSTKGVPHSNCGKWLVAQDDEQATALQNIHKSASSLGVTTHFISKAEASSREPDVRAESAVLESPTTGILDSHAYMQALLGDLSESGGETAFNSTVTKIEPLGERKDGQGGWRIFTDGSDNPEDAITAETLINSAGLAAIHVHNMIVPEERKRKPYYAKGKYYSYSASSPKPSTLVYPAPVPGHGGLGTHLTLDMAGRIRFGPDVEWVDDPTDLSVNDKGFIQALDDIQTYLPTLKRDSVHLDYCGIRPKLGKSSAQAGSTFLDFYIKAEEGYKGWVNLMGIESPGLTSSLAIGEHVHDMLYRK